MLSTGCCVNNMNSCLDKVRNCSGWIARQLLTLRSSQLAMTATAPRKTNPTVLFNGDGVVQPARHLANVVFGQTFHQFWRGHKRNLRVKLAVFAPSKHALCTDYLPAHLAWVSRAQILLTEHANFAELVAPHRIKQAPFGEQKGEVLPTSHLFNLNIEGTALGHAKHFGVPVFVSLLKPSCLFEVLVAQAELAERVAAPHKQLSDYFVRLRTSISLLVLRVLSAQRTATTSTCLLTTVVHCSTILV